MAVLAEPAIVLDHQPGRIGPFPVVLGGWPQLPETLNWPRTAQGVPMHFLAQIDLSALPKGLTVEDVELALPEHPGTGTLFVFGACRDYQLWQSKDPVRVLYHDGQVLDLAPVAPPNETPLLDENGTIPAHFWMRLDRTGVPEATSLVA